MTRFLENLWQRAYFEKRVLITVVTNMRNFNLSFGKKLEIFVKIIRTKWQDMRLTIEMSNLVEISLKVHNFLYRNFIDAKRYNCKYLKIF